MWIKGLWLTIMNSRQWVMTTRSKDSVLHISRIATVGNFYAFPSIRKKESWRESNYFRTANQRHNKRSPHSLTVKQWINFWPFFYRSFRLTVLWLRFRIIIRQICVTALWPQNNCALFRFVVRRNSLEYRRHNVEDDLMAWTQMKKKKKKCQNNNDKFIKKTYKVKCVEAYNTLIPRTEHTSKSMTDDDNDRRVINGHNFLCFCFDPHSYPLFRLHSPIHLLLFFLSFLFVIVSFLREWPIDWHNL